MVERHTEGIKSLDLAMKSDQKNYRTQATWWGGDGKGDGELIVTTNCITHSSWLNQPQQPDSFSLPSPLMCLIVVNSSA